MEITVLINKLKKLNLMITFSGQNTVIDPNQVVAVVFGLYEPEEFDDDGQPTKFREVIFITYSNGASDRFPATPENLAEAKLIIASKKSGNTPP